MNETWEGLIIIGMGNPLLSDDGVGIHAARALGRSFPGAVMRMTPMVGMDILEFIVGYDSLCLVDAMTTGEFPLGAVSRFHLTAQGLHLSSSHGPDLEGLLSLGECLGLNIPRIIMIYGIEIAREIPYGEDLTPALQKRINGAVEKIAADMRMTLCSTD